MKPQPDVSPSPTLRDHTRTDVLLKSSRKGLRSLDQLLDAALPTLAARLWQTCCWPDRMSDGWKIGDFNFLIVSISPEPETNLYVQFWSEPQEVVLVEICSGNWNPGAVKYVQAPQRRAIEALGYTPGGEAENYEKEVVVTSPAEAEAAAREALSVFYDIFNYRGRCPLDLQCHQGERADHRPVYTSLTPEDFLKVAAEAGYRPPRSTEMPEPLASQPPDENAAGASRRNTASEQEDDAPFWFMMRHRRRTLVQFASRVPKNNLFSAVLLRRVISPPSALSDVEVSAIDDKLGGMWLRQARTGDLLLGMDLMLAGGVTAEWLTTMLETWDGACERCERMIRRAGAKAGGRRLARKGSRRVH